jgi:hypothetical protein
LLIVSARASAPVTPARAEDHASSASIKASAPPSVVRRLASSDVAEGDGGLAGELCRRAAVAGPGGQRQQVLGAVGGQGGVPARRAAVVERV